MAVNSSTKTSINKILFNKTDFLKVDRSQNSQWAIFVHSSVLPYFTKFLELSFLSHIVLGMWPYELKIDESHRYDMWLVYIALDPIYVPNIIEELINNIQFAFRWWKLTLFRDEDRYSELEEFIEINDLQKYIVHNYVQAGVNSQDKQIKMITLSDHLNPDEWIKKFGKFLEKKPRRETENEIYHYYVTLAFSWLQPSHLQHMERPIRCERKMFGLNIFLYAQSLDTNSALNPIELCSLKLATCNVRKESAECKLSQHIDELIIKSLQKLNNDDLFDLNQYALDTNFNSFADELASDYLLYHFQKYFATFKPAAMQHLDFPAHLPIAVQTTIEISQFQGDALLQTLRQKTNIILAIDGSEFSEMNVELLASLLKFRNIRLITLDSNYAWHCDSETGIVHDAANSGVVVRVIEGKESSNFIDSFIKSLTLMSNTQSMRLYFLNTKPTNFSIFKHLNIFDITFDNITITSSALEELLACNMPDSIAIWFINCKIDDNVRTWTLLNEFQNLICEIDEDETTWQYMFEYVHDRLVNLEESAEFEFNICLRILDHHKRPININKMKFTIKSTDTVARLELRDLFSDHLIDVFDIKNLDYELREKSYYEFYQ